VTEQESGNGSGDSDQLSDDPDDCDFLMKVSSHKVFTYQPEFLILLETTKVQHQRPDPVLLSPAPRRNPHPPEPRVQPVDGQPQSQQQHLKRHVGAGDNKWPSLRRRYVQQDMGR
jgi:hypothetical protein